ncbi:MAG: NADH-quinone oxidoreductase subunit H [Planctomycetaceae bacterium]|nr:NADH-quinone oxidoreductase subunit H [Planctomycetaceae bacterium]
MTFAANSIASYLVESSLSPETAGIIAAVIHFAVLFGVFSVCPAAFIWLERKGSGRIQDRLGPTRVGGRFGWLQSLADGLKLFQKEDLCPPVADKMLFRAAPYIVCLSSFAAFAFLPFSSGWVAVSADCGLFIMLAILSLEVFGIILAGYCSGSKWSLFGGMREAAQMVSYEIPLAICALVPLVSAGSLNLGEIGQMQSGWFGNWFMFHDPFTFIAFFVYFVVATAGCKRAPFDLAEAESELVGGFHTEYSGLRWSYFFMGEYASMFAVCGIASILFAGGWHTGIPGVDGMLEGWRANESGNWALAYLANVLGAGVFASKAALGVFVQIWLRWTLPRLRIDQVMTTCLKYLLPISCFLFLGAVVWPLVLVTATGKSTLWPEPVGNRAVAGYSAGDMSSADDEGDTGSGESVDSDEGAESESPAESEESVSVGLLDAEVQ